MSETRVSHTLDESIFLSRVEGRGFHVEFTRHLFFTFLLFLLMTLIASIITFSKKKKKKNWEKKCYPRPSTWYPRPRHGTLDPRQKDRLPWS